MVSCEKDPFENNSQSTFSFVEVGNKWTYEWYAEGAEASVTIAYEITAINEDGFIEVICTNSLYDNQTDFNWFTNDEFFADETGAEPDELFPLYFKNGQVGKKWLSPVEDEDLGTITREIISTSETITVEAGTFTNCYKIKQTYELDSNIVDYFWIHNNTGIVKKVQTGWLDINDDPRIYFSTTTKLQSKNQ
jgi:hypothetical protein